MIYLLILLTTLNFVYIQSFPTDLKSQKQNVQKNTQIPSNLTVYRTQTNQNTVNQSKQGTPNKRKNRKDPIQFTFHQIDPKQATNAVWFNQAQKTPSKYRQNKNRNKKRVPPVSVPNPKDSPEKVNLVQTSSPKKFTTRARIGRHKFISKSKQINRYIYAQTNVSQYTQYSGKSYILNGGDSGKGVVIRVGVDGLYVAGVLVNPRLYRDGFGDVSQYYVFEGITTDYYQLQGDPIIYINNTQKYNITDKPLQQLKKDQNITLINLTSVNRGNDTIKTMNDLNGSGIIKNADIIASKNMKMNNSMNKNITNISNNRTTNSSTVINNYSGSNYWQTNQTMSNIQGKTSTKMGFEQDQDYYGVDDDQDNYDNHDLNQTSVVYVGESKYTFHDVVARQIYVPSYIALIEGTDGTRVQLTPKNNSFALNLDRDGVYLNGTSITPTANNKTYKIQLVSKQGHFKQQNNPTLYQLKPIIEDNSTKVLDLSSRNKYFRRYKRVLTDRLGGRHVYYDGRGSSRNGNYYKIRDGRIRYFQRGVEVRYTI